MLCIGYDVCRYYLHQRAVSTLSSRLYAGAPPLEVSALPTPLNPFSWRGIVVTKTTYLQFNVNTLFQLNTDSAKSYFRIPLSEAIVSVQRTPAFSYFLYFARFPVWAVQPVELNSGTGKRIELTDLRFGEPGAGDFHCVAIENAAGQVLGSWFTFGSGAGLGWTDPKKR